MSNNIKIDTDFWTIAIVLSYIAFNGSPDVVDGVVYKLTGEKVWEQSSVDQEQAKWEPK